MARVAAIARAVEPVLTHVALGLAGLLLGTIGTALLAPGAIEG
jgi:hypothetical protein